MTKLWGTAILGIACMCGSAAGVAAQSDHAGEIRDLSMRAATSQELVKQRIEATGALADSLEKRTAGARKKLQEIRRGLDGVTAALGSATTLVEIGVAAPTGRGAQYDEEIDAAQKLAKRYEQVVIALSMRAASRTDEGIKIAEQVAGASADSSAADAMLCLAILHADAGNFDKAKKAVSSAQGGNASSVERTRALIALLESAKTERATARAQKRLDRDLRRFSQGIERKQARLLRDLRSLQGKRDKLAQAQHKQIEKQLSVTSKQLKTAATQLEQARQLLPKADEGASSDVGDLHALAQEGKEQLKLYDKLLLALKAYDSRKFASASSTATDVAASAKGELAFDALLLAGMAQYRSGDFAGAKQTLSPAALQTARPDAARFFALATAKSGNKAAALALLRKASLRDDDAESWVLLATLLVETKDSGAGKALDKAISLAPSNHFLVVASSKQLLARKQYKEAIPMLQRAMALDPADRDSAYLLSRAYQGAGQVEDAHKVLQTYASGSPGDSGAGRDASLRQPEHSLFVVPTYPIASGLPDDRDDAAASLQLASYLLRFGRLEAADSELSGIKSPSADAHHARGIVYLRLGYYEDAGSAFAEAARLDPKNPAGFHGLGVTMLRRGELELAKKHFERALAVKSDGLPSLGLAVVAARTGHLGDAVKQLQGLRRDKSITEAVRISLAAAQHSAGKNDAALKTLGALKRQSSATPEEFMLGGRLAAANSDNALASAHFKEATMLAPSYTDAWFALGKAALAAGETRVGAEALRRYLDSEPKDTDAREHLAKTYETTGETEMAKRERDRIVQIRTDARDQLADTVRDGAIGVGTFANVSKSEEHDWMSQGIPEALATDLGKAGLRIVERTQIAKAIEEQKLGEFGMVDPATAPKVGKLIGAQTMVVGSFQIQKDKIRVSARLIRVSDGRVLQAAESSGQVENLFIVERRLAMDLVRDYYGLDEAAQSAVLGAPVPKNEALKKITAARVLLLKGDDSAAAAAFQKAMDEDPEFAKEVAKFEKEWSGIAATVACLPLANVSRKKEHDWYSRGISESLCGDLHRIGIFVVERLAIEKVFEERRFIEIFDPEKAKELGSQFGASMVMVGGYQIVDGRLQIDARMVDVQTGQVMLAEQLRGEEKNLFELQSELAGKISKVLDRPVTKEDLARMREGNPDIDKFKKYLAARSELVVSDKPGDKVNVHVVGISAFVNSSGRKADDALGATLVRRVEDSLRKEKKLKVVDRAAIATATSEGEDPLAKAEQLGADAMVLGEYSTAFDQVQINARVVSTKTGEVLVTVKAGGKQEELAQVEEQLSRSLLSGMGLLAKNEDPAGSMGKPFYKKWWFWGAGAAAVTAGVVGIMAVDSGQTTFDAR